MASSLGVKPNHPPERKVFCVNVGRKNYTELEKYGEPVYLSAGYVKLYPEDKLGELEKHLRLALAMSDDEDYVMLSGPPLLNIIVFRLWMAKHRKIRTLNWSGSNYFVSELTK